MLDSLHDPHLILYFLIQNAVLHELALVEFLRCVGLAGELHGHLVYRGESTSADFAHAIVLVRASPWLWQCIAAGSAPLFCTAVRHLRSASYNAVVAVRGTKLPWGRGLEYVDLADLVSKG